MHVCMYHTSHSVEILRFLWSRGGLRYARPFDSPSFGVRIVHHTQASSWFHRVSQPFPRLIMAAVALAVLAACGEKPDAHPQMPPPEVTAVVAQSRDVPRQFEYVGQVAGVRDAEVRARVGGILVKRLYTEGKAVKQGDPLFLIDPEPLKASSDQARAALALEEAKLARAKLERDRILPLFAENAVSQKDRDDAVTNYESAVASAAAARARLKEASINLGYTRVTAPISGLTSKEVVSEGSLIAPSNLLTVVSQTDPVYVNFAMADNDSLHFRKLVQEGVLVAPKDEKYAVEVAFSDGSRYARTGQVNFTDNVIDTSTGTIRARAIFTNPDAELIPGQFVRVYLKGITQRNAILIPQRAVLSTPQGQIVFVVNEESKAEPRPVSIGDEIGRDFIITSGIRNGDRVIVDGAIKSRPGQPVKVVESQPPTPATKP